MNPSRRSLLVFSAAAGAAGLAATGSAQDPVRSPLFKPSIEVCRQSLAGTPGSFTDAGVNHVLEVLNVALASNPTKSALVGAVGLALEDAYPGQSSLAVGETTYQYVIDPVTGQWIRVCTQKIEGLVNDDPSDPVVIAIGLSEQVV